MEITGKYYLGAPQPSFLQQKQQLTPIWQSIIGYTTFIALELRLIKSSAVIGPVGHKHSVHVRMTPNDHQDPYLSNEIGCRPTQYMAIT